MISSITTTVEHLRVLLLVPVRLRNAVNLSSPTEAKLPSIRPAYSAMDLEHYGDAGFHRNYSQLSQIKASSRYCGIRLGELVVTRVPESFPGVKITDLGRYRITEITHTVNYKGQYSNTFCGVPVVRPSGRGEMP